MKTYIVGLATMVQAPRASSRPAGIKIHFSPPVEAGAKMHVSLLVAAVLALALMLTDEVIDEGCA